MHVLMLETFRGPRPEGYLACHKDDDPENWRLDNLYWGTPRENQLDIIRNRKRNYKDKIAP